MVKILQFPRDVTAEADALVLPEGALFIDLTRDEIRLHDGLTPGGHRIPNISALNAVFIRKDEGLGPDVGFPAGGTGFLIRVDVDNFIVRILEVSAGLTLANADGVADNPELGIDDAWLLAFIVALHATVADIRSNVAEKILTTDEAFLASAFVVTTYAATVAFDFSLAFNFVITATGNVSLGNPTNIKQQNGIIEILANGADRTVTLGVNWKDPGLLFPVVIPSGTRGYISYFVNSLGEPVIAGVLGV